MNLRAIDLLDCFAEPVLIVDQNGTVEIANRAAQRFAGNNLIGLNIGSSPAVRTFLRRSAGTSSPLIGTICLPSAGSKENWIRCHGRRLRQDNAHVLLRAAPAEDDKFSVLTARIKALNSEIGRHRRTQLLLQESLEDRELLLREVHHRVKNNIQILLAMLRASARDTKSEEVRDRLADAARRLEAMATVQHELYHTDKPPTTRADQFLEALIAELRKSWSSSLTISMIADPIVLPETFATPIALIVNELLTNAVKYAGHPEQPPHVRLSLLRQGETIELLVEDDGPGLPPPQLQRRSSGLALVQGLTRQLKGNLTVEPGVGARFRITFPYNNNPDISSGGTNEANGKRIAANSTGLDRAIAEHQNSKRSGA